jgi:hypothetical protein
MSVNSSLSLDDDDDEHVFRYEPRETSDVVIIVKMVDNELKYNGIVFKFHVHKAVLATQCDFFAATFAVDKSATEVLMPDSFVYRMMGKTYLSITTKNVLLLLFDTLCNVSNKCWWSLNTEQRRSVINNEIGQLINPVFYVGYKTLLCVIEDYLIKEHLPKNKLYTPIAALNASEYKMQALEEHALVQLEYEFSHAPIKIYHTLYVRPEIIVSLIPQRHLLRYLKGACKVKD